MKLIKTLIASIVIVLFASPTGAITYEEIEDNILKKCEKTASFNWLERVPDRSEFYYCSLLQLITFKKIMGHYRDHGGIINKLMEKYWDKKYNTSNWPQVLDDLEEYLKEKEKENERDNLSYRTDFGRQTGIV